MPTTLAIDFGSRYIGIALVDHPEPRHNRVLYAATLVVEPRPLNALVETRAEVRRLRRSRKTHHRRLRRLAQALAGIPNTDVILRFCRRRGYSHQESDDADPAVRSFQFHRSEFFEALRVEVTRVIETPHQARVLAACSRHLNESCHREAELRPARFENRGPTRCGWEGCTRHVPKAENDFVGRLRQSLCGWLSPVFRESTDAARLRRSVKHWVRELDGLARAYRRSPDADTRKPINRRVQVVYRHLLNRVAREATADTAEKFRQDWQEHYRKGLTEIVRGKQTGRVRYCRQHSVEYADYLLAGKAIPNRQDLTEADLVSRKQQIVFRRLWRLVESRLLPLAGGKIERVVVERVAFDALAGPFKARQELSQETASEMYWQGPQLGFASRLDMLREEFGGRCAYCGQPGTVEQVEHLLPRSQFPFDSYFNVLPACTACNNRKGARTALEAGLTVHPEAYAAFSEYLRKKKVLHAWHAIKKGLLNLLCRTATAGEAERRLAMLANDLVTATASQRSPRPLARYLATRLEQRTGHRPDIGFRAGRHTALYRSVMLAEYDKVAAKEENDLRNHAVDAVVLGCDMPSASAMENKNWKLGSRDIHAWFEAVHAAAPETLLGLPRVEPVPFVPHFEVDLGGGYCQIELSAFNWNRRRKATHVLDPFGMTVRGSPLKRKAAAEVLKKLSNPETRAGEIEQIAQAGLRTFLQKDLARAPERLVQWLQQTVLAGLRQGRMTTHSADLARRELLERFAQAPVENVVAGEESVPVTIGIRCLNRGSMNKLDVERVGKDGKVFQRYQADPVVRELYVGYCMRDGELARNDPVVLVVNQIHAVRRQKGNRRVPVDVAVDSPLRGRPHGMPQGGEKEFLARWREDFASFCARERIMELFRVRQGCVIEKTDGTRLQFRNFDRGGPWMRPDAFRGIVRVYRSPLQTM
jgi:5-methylcytosine-specific restriction endonuclease McrA